MQELPNLLLLDIKDGELDKVNGNGGEKFGEFLRRLCVSKKREINDEATNASKSYRIDEKYESTREQTTTMQMHMR
jgi:hypothetical protein